MFFLFVQKPERTRLVTPIDEPIEVQVVDGRPAAFEWTGQVYRIVDILHIWQSEERIWWKFSGHTRRHYRVQAGWNRHRVTAEIYTTVGGEEEWILSAVYD